MNSTVETVVSADGTPIALQRQGDGPPVILIGGAFNDRSTVAGLAATLAPDLTAVIYDRRGRGDSGDNSANSDAVAIDREFDDLAAVISHVAGPGGSAGVFGHSSGAVLALEAAAHGVAIGGLALYETPYIVEGTRPRPGSDLVDRIRALLGEGRRDEAVAVFQTEQIGLPPQMVEGMRASEMWGWLTGHADSLPYDLAICGPGCVLPAGRLAAIRVPALVISGSNTFPWISEGTRAVAKAIPGSRFVTLEGQDHGVLQQPQALRPLLLDFFA